MLFWFTPRRTLITGAVVLVIGVLVGILAPDIISWSNPFFGDAVGVSSFFPVLTFTGIVGEVCVPGGIGLICAAIVMAYVDSRASHGAATGSEQ